MYLARTYSSRADIPKGAEGLYKATGNLFILQGVSGANGFEADNPWDPASWSLTSQGNFITTYGMNIAAVFAKMANSKIGATKPTVIVVAPALTVLIQRRNITGGASGGSDTSNDALAKGLMTKVN